MSDRDLICKNCGKEIEARGWTHDDSIFCDVPGLQYAEPALVEPPVLSRAAIDEMIAKTMEAFIADAKEPLSTWEIHLARVGMNFLRDAILESLSQEATDD